MDTVAELEKTIWFINTMLWIFAINIFDENWNVGYKRIRTFITNVILFGCQIETVAYVLDNMDDFTKLPESFAISLQALQSSIKYWFLMVHYKKIWFIVSKMKQYRSDYAKYPETLPIILKYNKRSYMLARLFYIIDNLAVSLLLVIPIFKLQYYTLPLCYYFPYLSFDVSPYYELNYINQVFVAYCCAHICACVDSMFILMISEACILLSVFQYECSLIGKPGCPKDIIKIIQSRHAEFYTFIRLIQDLSSGILIVQFGISLIGFCNIMYTVSGIIEVNGVLKMYALMFATVLQLFGYCWFGQDLNDKIYKINSFMYMGDWYILPRKDASSMIIMMSYSQAQVSLKAGGYFSLSLNTFLSIMKTAYSYFAVMQQKSAN